MKGHSVFTNSTQIYDILKRSGIDVTMLYAKYDIHEPPLVFVDELPLWLEKRKEDEGK